MESTGPIIITLAFILLVGLILSCVRRRRAMALQQQYLAQQSQVTELGAIPEVYTNYAYQYPPPAGSPYTAYAPPPTASPYSSAPVVVPAQTYTAYPPMPQTQPSSRPGPYYVPPQDGSAASAPNTSASAPGSSQNPEETAMPPPPYSAVVKY